MKTELNYISNYTSKNRGLNRVNTDDRLVNSTFWRHLQLPGAEERTRDRQRNINSKYVHTVQKIIANVVIRAGNVLSAFCVGVACEVVCVWMDEWTNGTDLWWFLTKKCFPFLGAGDSGAVPVNTGAKSAFFSLFPYPKLRTKIISFFSLSLRISPSASSKSQEVKGTLLLTFLVLLVQCGYKNTTN